MNQTLGRERGKVYSENVPRLMLFFVYMFLVNTLVVGGYESLNGRHFLIPFL